MSLFFILFYMIIYQFFIKITNKKILLFLGIFPLFLALAFQEGIGTDYYSYIKIFNKEEILKFSRGPLFIMLIDFLRYLTVNERFMFITVAAIQMTTYYKIVYIMNEIKIIKNISLFIFLSVIVTGFYLMQFNALRSSIASLIAVLGVLFIEEHKNKKGKMLIIFGGGFHPSIIIWEVIFFYKKLLYIKYSVNKIFLYFFLCFFLNKINFINKVSHFLYYNINFNFPYKYHLISQHMYAYTKSLGIGPIMNFIFFSMSLYFYKYDKNKKNLFFYNLGYLYIGLRFLFTNIPIFMRLLEISNLFQTYVIYKLVEKTLSKKYFYFGNIVILFYVLNYIKGSLLMLQIIKN